MQKFSDDAGQTYCDSIVAKIAASQKYMDKMTNAQTKKIQNRQLMMDELSRLENDVVLAEEGDEEARMRRDRDQVRREELREVRDDMVQNNLNGRKNQMKNDSAKPSPRGHSHDSAKKTSLRGILSANAG